MSLHDIAKHVQSQGRGQDTVLVHMTPNEVGGLQALAKAHGGSLTRNPQTGLYEAGFLSSVLPMVAGVAASAFLGPEMLPLIAGGVGLADYAMTGSLTQGLMAGLGAWGGYGLGAGIGAAGTAELAAQGADVSAETFAKSQQAALGAGGNALPQGFVPTETGAYNPATGVEVTQQSLAQNQLANSGLTANQQSIFNDAIARNPAQTADIMRGAGATAVNPTAQQGFMQGITSPSAIGSAIKANPMAAAGAALPLVSGSLFKQPTVNAPANSVTTVNQPLQRLSPNYQGTTTATPTTHYQATYPNYVQTPYNPYTGTPAVQSPGATTYAAEGGLMGKAPTPGLMDSGRSGNVDFMGGDMYPTSQQHRSYYATPTQMPTSAQATMASYEPKTNPLTGEMTANMAEGGIASLADGGNTTDHIYHPSYTNYAQTPYSPSTTTAYSPANIPIPTRASLDPGAISGIAGYALDPSVMKTNAQIAADIEAKRLADLRSQDPLALGGPFNMAGGGLTAFAQGSKDAVGNKDMAAIDAYTAQAREEGGLAAIKDAADKGDWNAMLALQKLGYKASGGGISTLGSYSDGGRLLKGPGDGVSDDIPAQIGQHQPAKLADGEFVVPARIVSELGNGSTDAGAKRLYAMMEKVQAKRKKSIGKGKFAVNSKAENDLPA